MLGVVRRGGGVFYQSSRHNYLESRGIDVLAPVTWTSQGRGGRLSRRIVSNGGDGDVGRVRFSTDFFGKTLGSAESERRLPGAIPSRLGCRGPVVRGAAELGRRDSHQAFEDAREVAVAREPKVRGQPREVAFAVTDPMQRLGDADAVDVLAGGQAHLGLEDPAEVMPGATELVRDVPDGDSLGCPQNEHLTHPTRELGECQAGARYTGGRPAGFLQGEGEGLLDPPLDDVQRNRRSGPPSPGHGEDGIEGGGEERRRRHDRGREPTPRCAEGIPACRQLRKEGLVELQCGHASTSVAAVVPDLVDLATVDQHHLTRVDQGSPAIDP